MPPYGDGTAPVDDESVLVMLSPPYGDGTIMDIEQIMAAMFSPPYGDKLQYQMLCLKTVNKGFSPPYGDGTTKEQIIYTPEMFSPPYGENPLSHGVSRDWGIGSSPSTPPALRATSPYTRGGLMPLHSSNRYTLVS